MPLNTDTYGRRDYLEAEFGDMVDNHPEYDLFAEKLAAEDERIWAWYRDPETDLTQQQARDRAQVHDYGDRYNLNQSSVSRKIKNLDEEMLTEPLTEISTDRAVFADYNVYRKVDRQRPAYTEALRRWLAKMICDRVVLSELEPPVYFDDADQREDYTPPEWALDRLGYAPDELITGWQNGRFDG